MSGSEAARYGETWVYESIVGAVPGLSLRPRTAVIVQFVVFEAVVLLLAASYDQWRAVPAGTVAVAVAAVGSAFMHDLGRRIRNVPVPYAYSRLLFGSSIEVVLGILAYAALLTYLFVVDPRTSGTLITDLLGPDPSILSVYLLLVVLWDVTYRIGTGWWAAVVSLWRTLRLDLDPRTANALRAADRRVLVFAAVQLALVPFLLGHPVLAIAVGGHVVAVFGVVGLSLALSRTP
ncbi:MAG: hypothetical protein ABEJ35_01300 [Halobacteriaceae archaeon]